MTTPIIQTLITAPDSFEAIRDQIGLILAANSAAQMALAVTAGQDPLLWKLRVFTERSNPWEMVLNDQSDLSPVINVWYDNGSFDAGASNTFERQKHVASYNVDCYGFAISEANGTGHKPGDREAAFEAHRTARLARKILMSAHCTYLGLRGTVWRRWLRSITVFQPQIDQRSIPGCVAARLALEVEFNEFAPQMAEGHLDEICVDIKRSDTGAIIAEYDILV